jgi:shikimate kinase
MGAGKSTLGKRLSELFELPFVDLDQEIERQSGAAVALIFDVEGESGFRARESRLLEHHCKRSGVVLATGGGAVLLPENRPVLRQGGFVVYLRTSVQTQWARLRRDRSRPLLRAPDPLGRLQELASQRNPIYAELADLIWDSPELHSSVSASLLAEAIKARWLVQHSPVGADNSNSAA